MLIHNAKSVVKAINNSKIVSKNEKGQFERIQASIIQYDRFDGLQTYIEVTCGGRIVRNMPVNAAAEFPINLKELKVTMV